MAVRKVTSNPGKNTPGVDQEIWRTAKQKRTALKMLKRRGYRALPLRRVFIPKKTGKLRPLGIPTMKDRAMQAIYLMALIPIAEETADPNAYGFRPYRSTADAIAQCFTLLAQRTAPQWILEGDITGCFDNISHDWLIDNVPMDKKILREWLGAGYIDRRRLFPTQAGTPQGGICSPTLANLTLSGLERELAVRFPKGNRAHLVVYADDFIVTGASKELLEREVRPVVESFLRERGLELSPEKTRIVHIREGFDFLGQNIRKYGDKLLIKPAKKNVLAFLDKVRDIVKGAKAQTQEWLIKKLNPIFRGWANFHRHIVAKSTFQWVDSQLFTLLWQWARRRHANKGARWIKKRYFQCIGGRNWVFTPEHKATQLFQVASTPIRRHVKIIALANPFDKKWTDYFAERKHAAKVRKELELLSGMAL